MCLRESHGQDSGGWYEKAGDVVVADLGERKRSVMLYGGPSSPGRPVLYGGGRYSPERGKREGWPRASQFMRAACASEPAAVWDHYHAHGFARLRARPAVQPLQRPSLRVLPRLWACGA